MLNRQQDSRFYDFKVHTTCGTFSTVFSPISRYVDDLFFGRYKRSLDIDLKSVLNNIRDVIESEYDK